MRCFSKTRKLWLLRCTCFYFGIQPEKLLSLSLSLSLCAYVILHIYCIYISSTPYQYASKLAPSIFTVCSTSHVVSSALCSRSLMVLGRVRHAERLTAGLRLVGVGVRCWMMLTQWLVVGCVRELFRQSHHFSCLAVGQVV